MFILISKGGPIMVLILLLSIIAGVIIIERLLFFRRIKMDEDKFIDRLKSAIQKGHYDEAVDICDNYSTPLANLMKVGIEHRNYGKAEIKESILAAANLEVPQLERYLTSLGTIAHISPLLGLLGTVTGNIKAFGVLGQFGSVADPSLLATGISEALLTTAAGIIVSIPAVAFHNYLVGKANYTITNLENRVNDMVLFFKVGD
ncbi:MAG: MotA/TolQ/ExbB proton channel family protein [Spirochaetaceae bacterium]|nr:MotA/TolQ/ExbB proton channel family protein [Spirochaetaceae bacterium]